jgi:thymidylate synthase
MTRQYLETLTAILQKGVKRPNRTGVDTLTLFGYQTRFNLAEGFPLLTTKRIYFRAVIHELL